MLGWLLRRRPPLCLGSQPEIFRDDGLVPSLVFLVLVMFDAAELVALALDLLAVPKEDPINSTLAKVALSSREIVKGTHLKKACPAVDLIQFKEVEFLLLTTGNNLHDRGWQLFKEVNFEPKIKMEVSQLATAYHLAQHAMAATFVIDRLVTKEKDNLCYYKLDSALAERLFYILLPERKYTSFAVRAFIQFFTEHML